MHNQSLRLFLYSSLAIVALTLVWGLRSIPKQGAAAEQQLRSSLEQELVILSSAVKSATNAMKFRLLDVLKAEGNDHPTRAFQDSPFAAVQLLEWDGSTWKPLWHSSKMKEQFAQASLQVTMRDWPLAKIAGDESYFAKVADADGQAYFAVVVPVRRPSNIPMLGVGVFPAAQFGLTFAAETTREIRVFDSKGFALALAHPAYIGASLKREPLVAEILEGDALSVRQEWKSERGQPLVGAAARVAGSNLFAAVETQMPLAASVYVQAWLYLLLCAAGAIAINWFLFSSMIQPLFEQLALTEEAVEGMRRQLIENPQPRTAAPAAAPLEQADRVIPSAELPNISFLGDSGPETVEAELPVAPPPRAPLVKIINSALRGLETRIKEYGITVNRIGLETVEVDSDILQLQTAIEEVLKNAVEAMADSPARQLTITAQNLGGRVNLTVEDTGCGISPDSIKKVFDPFYSTKDSEGVARGLGLNVVRRVVEELHGSVDVRNRQAEQGVAVEIEWPLGRPAEVQAAESEAAPPAVVPSIGAAAAAAAAQAERDFALDLLDDEEEFSAVNMIVAREYPKVPIRKPKVRTLD